MAGYITIDASDLNRVNQAMALYPREAKAAMSTTLNRAANKVVTYIHDEVSNEYAVKRAGIKKTISIKKSNVNTLRAEIKSVDRRLKVSGFPFTARGRKRVANVKIKQGGYVGSTSNPPLFVGKANKTTGRREVFIRMPSEGDRLSFGFTIAIPQMIANDSVYDQISQRTSEFIGERFEHELSYRLHRIT